MVEKQGVVYTHSTLWVEVILLVLVALALRLQTDKNPYWLERIKMSHL